MYGKVLHLPITEYTPMHPLSPYAISKASAHWTVVNYRESYGLFSCNGVLFNHESYLRSNNFFVKKVISESLRIKAGLQAELRVGNIDIRRDFGFARRYRSIIDKDLYRPTDIEDIYGYNQKARKVLGWNYTMSFFEVLDILVQQEEEAFVK